MNRIPFAVLALSLFCGSAYGGPVWPIEGEWGQIDGPTSAFQYLRIDLDGPGAFIHSYPGHPTVVVRFNADNITEDQGLFTIRIPACNGVERVLVAAAFREDSAPERGLLTGVLYLFRQGELSKRELFNSVLVRTERLVDGDNPLTESVNQILKSSPGNCDLEKSNQSTYLPDHEFHVIGVRQLTHT